RKGHVAVHGGLSEIPRRRRLGAPDDRVRWVEEDAPARQVAVLAEDRGADAVFEIAVAAGVRDLAARRDNLARRDFEAGLVDAAAGGRGAHDIEKDGLARGVACYFSAAQQLDAHNLRGGDAREDALE